MRATIPRIKLSRLTTGPGGGRRQAVTTLGDGFRDPGSIRIEGHGIEADVLSDVRHAGLAQAVEQVTVVLLEGLAEYFGLPHTTFSPRAAEGDLGILVETDRDDGVDGGPPSGRGTEREDLALVTVLSGADGAGLEILGRQGAWIPVTPRAGELVVCPGTLLEQLTNGVVPATRYRYGDLPAPREKESTPVRLLVRPRSSRELSTLGAFASASRSGRVEPGATGEAPDGSPPEPV